MSSLQKWKTEQLGFCSEALWKVVSSMSFKSLYVWLSLVDVATSFNSLSSLCVCVCRFSPLPLLSWCTFIFAGFQFLWVSWKCLSVFAVSICNFSMRDRTEKGLVRVYMRTWIGRHLLNDRSVPCNALLLLGWKVEEQLYIPLQKERLTWWPLDVIITLNKWSRGLFRLALGNTFHPKMNHQGGVEERSAPILSQWNPN